MGVNDISSGFGATNPTMLERLERDVRKTRVYFDLDYICHLFLFNFLLFEVERR